MGSADITIYAIQNTITKKIYVGRAKDAIKRFQAHMSLLRIGEHSVEDMQDDFNDFGEASFVLFILEDNLPWNLKHREYVWMQKLNSHIREVGYNYKDKKVASFGKGIPTPIPLQTGYPTPLALDEEIR